MTNNGENRQPRAVKWGWGLLVTLSALLTLNGLALYFFIADSYLMQTVSLMEIGLGLLALVVAWEGFRQGSRWAWKAIWVLVALLATLGLHMLLGGDAGVSLWYLTLAGIALFGQLMVRRGFTT